MTRGRILFAAALALIFGWPLYAELKDYSSDEWELAIRYVVAATALSTSMESPKDFMASHPLATMPSWASPYYDEFSGDTAHRIWQSFEVSAIYGCVIFSFLVVIGSATLIPDLFVPQLKTLFAEIELSRNRAESIRDCLHQSEAATKQLQAALQLLTAQAAKLTAAAPPKAPSRAKEPESTQIELVQGASSAPPPRRPRLAEPTPAQVLEPDFEF